jgi:hypothetical protein
MKQITIFQKGDTWFDRGLIVFHDLIKDDKVFFETLLLYSNSLVLELKETFFSMKERWLSAWEALIKRLYNEQIIPSREAKILHLRGYESGEWWDIRWTQELSEEEQVRLNDFKSKHSLNYNFQKSASAELMRNYIGIKNDLEKIRKEYTEICEGVWEQWKGSEDTETIFCDYCGREYPKKYKFTLDQSRDPFTNQHHNAKVRGYNASVTKYYICPQCALIFLLSSLETHYPYVMQGKAVNVFLPKTADLKTLGNLHSKFKDKLRNEHIRQRPSDLTPEYLNYSNNLPKLKQGNLDLALVGIYYALQQEFGKKVKGFNPRKEYGGLQEWILMPFEKGKNVIFSHFINIKPGSNMFILTQPISYVSQDVYKENDIYSFLVQMGSQFDDEISLLCKGIIYESITYWAVGFKKLYLKGQDEKKYRQVSYFTTEFMRNYMEYYLEVIKVLKGDPVFVKELQEMGRILGKNFPNDVGMMTALSTITNCEQLREYLSKAFFKIYKFAATAKDFRAEQGAGQKGNSDQGIKACVYFEEGKLLDILNKITDENTSQVRDILLMFASFWGIRTLYDQSGAKKEETNS